MISHHRSCIIALFVDIIIGHRRHHLDRKRLSPRYSCLCMISLSVLYMRPVSQGEV